MGKRETFHKVHFPLLPGFSWLPSSRYHLKKFQKKNSTPLHAFSFPFSFSAKFFFSHVVRIFQKSNDEEWSNLISVYLIIQKWEKKFRRRTEENLAMSLQSKSRKIRIERKLVSEKWIDQWNPNWLPWLRRNSIFAARRAISLLLSSYLADYRGDRDLYIYIYSFHLEKWGEGSRDLIARGLKKGCIISWSKEIPLLFSVCR